MRVMIILGLVLIGVSDYVFFKAGRTWERQTVQQEISSCQSDSFHNKRALEGCEEANHLAMEDASGCAQAKQQAQECADFLEGLNNLEEILK